ILYQPPEVSIDPASGFLAGVVVACFRRAFAPVAGIRKAAGVVAVDKDYAAAVLAGRENPTDVLCYPLGLFLKHLELHRFHPFVLSRLPFLFPLLRSGGCP